MESGAVVGVCGSGRQSVASQSYVSKKFTLI